ncbi:hypothetical protein MIS33_08350 [Wielerella bovis]|nr:hypothetical protein [Wielerella bovis]ULJ64161.1 hypothetical protein MIS33_08350 [Wielerella bovis]
MSMKLSTARSNTFFNKFTALCEKYNLEVAYDESRKSGSTYFTAMNGLNSIEFRISDHSYAGFGGIDKHTLYVEDFANSNEMLKEIEHLILVFITES